MFSRVSFHPIENSVKFHLMTWAAYFKRRNSEWKTPTMLRKHVCLVVDTYILWFYHKGIVGILPSINGNSCYLLNNVDDNWFVGGIHCLFYIYVGRNWILPCVALCNLSSVNTPSSSKYSGLFGQSSCSTKLCHQTIE